MSLEASILPEVIAFGLWPSLPFSGYLVISYGQSIPKLKDLPTLVRLSLLITIGIILWSIPMLILAILGWYHASVIGVVAWMVTSLGIHRLIKEHDVDCLSACEKLSAWDVILLIGLLIAAVLYFGFPMESILGGRDQGVYSNHAIYLSRTGQLNVPYPWQESLQATESLRAIFSSFPGLYKTEPLMTVQFAHLFPLWLAQTFSSFGYQGLFRLNAFFSLLSVICFYGLCRFFIRREYAVLATLFLALNPSQIWMSRITLTEIMTQLLVIAGFVLLLAAVKNRSTWLLFIAGVVLGCSALVRIDAFFLLPLFLLSAAFLNLFIKEEHKEYKPGITFYVSSTCTLALAILYYFIFSNPYFFHLVDELRKVGFLSLLSFAFLILSVLVRNKKLGDKLDKILTNQILIFTVGALFLLLAIFAYFVRPHIEPYAVYDWPNHPLDGTRDYREDSLIRVSQYLSFPVVWIAVAGWTLHLRDILKNREKISQFLISLTVLSFSLLYLWKPSISPDHFWAVRRYVPVVIPGFILFAYIGINSLVASRKPRDLVSFLLIGCTVAFSSFFLSTSNSILYFSENKGYYNQLLELSQSLPEGEIILANGIGTWETPLYLSFGKKIVPVNLDSPLASNKLSEYIDDVKSSGSDVYLLDDDGLDFPGATFVELNSFDLSRKFSEPTLKPLPKRILSEVRNIKLYKLNSVSSSYRNIVFGHRKAFAIEEEGFYHSEWSIGRGIPVRWTNGKAKLKVPLQDGYQPRTARFYFASGPVETDFKILCNNQEIFNGTLPANSSWVRSLSLPENKESTLLIEILSDTFKPSARIQGSSDARNLGLLVQGIRLFDQEPNLKQLQDASEEKHLSSIHLMEDIVQGQSISAGRNIEVSIVNEGTTIWRSAYDIGEPRNSIQLGVIWASKKSPNQRLGEQRVSLPYTVFPNEKVNLRFTLDPIDYNGLALKPGEYEVWIGLVEEGVTWFYDKGDDILKLPVRVER